MTNQALSVLLVDDDLAFYRLIRQMIAGLNYHIQLGRIQGIQLTASTQLGLSFVIKVRNEYRPDTPFYTRRQ